MARANSRKPSEIRPVHISRGYTKNAPGSVLIKAGDTHVLCTASFEQGVPKWREGSGLGWVTAEYDMLPGSTSSRRPRNRSKIDGRTQEIQRLIGRTMRSVVDMARLGEHSIVLDCDVLQADGGTRTASITGGYVAMCDAIQYGLKQKFLTKTCVLDHVAAISVGKVSGQVLLDLNYEEDVSADVDLNLAMTGKGQLIELQATGEEATFTRTELDKMLDYGAKGIRKLIQLQKTSLSKTRRPR